MSQLSQSLTLNDSEGCTGIAEDHCAHRLAELCKDALQPQEVHRKNSFVKGSMIGGNDAFDDVSDDEDISDDNGHSDESESISINDGESSGVSHTS